MRVFTAPEKIEYNVDIPTVFLAGGIVGCEVWQDTVIKHLGTLGSGMILNPRRENYPWGDSVAEVEQIKWEFEALERCDVFSMWFSGGESPQPICMYELGRRMALFDVIPQKVVIGTDPEYVRRRDVEVQMSLVAPNIKIHSNLDSHAYKIMTALQDSYRGR